VAASHSTAQAACQQALAFGLDVSKSVDAEEYQLQLKGLAAALTSPDVTSSILTMPRLSTHSSTLDRHFKYRSLGKPIN